LWRRKCPGPVNKASARAGRSEIPTVGGVDKVQSMFRDYFKHEQDFGLPIEQNIPAKLYL
jgi:hypothetical protein